MGVAATVKDVYASNYIVENSELVGITGGEPELETYFGNAVSAGADPGISYGLVLPRVIGAGMFKRIIE
jgi:hypothetical protein